MENTEISFIDFSMKIYRSFKKQRPILWTRFNLETSEGPFSFLPAPLGSATQGHGPITLPYPRPALVLLPLPLVWYLQWGLAQVILLIPAGCCWSPCFSLYQNLPCSLAGEGTGYLQHYTNTIVRVLFFFSHFYYSSPSALLPPHPTLPLHWVSTQPSCSNLIFTTYLFL